MSAIKNLMEAIWDLHWQGKTRKEILTELGCSEDIYDGAMELYREMTGDE